jgi:hypothetical protein
MSFYYYVIFDGNGLGVQDFYLIQALLLLTGLHGALNKFILTPCVLWCCPCKECHLMKTYRQMKMTVLRPMDHLRASLIPHILSTSSPVQLT